MILLRKSSGKCLFEAVKPKLCCLASLKRSKKSNVRAGIIFFCHFDPKLRAHLSGISLVLCISLCSLFGQFLSGKLNNLKNQNERLSLTTSLEEERGKSNKQFKLTWIDCLLYTRVLHIRLQRGEFPQAHGEAGSVQVLLRGSIPSQSFVAPRGWRLED